MALGVKDALTTTMAETDISASGNGEWVRLGTYRTYRAVLTVGGDVSGTNPTLDVTVQGSSDGSGGSDATLATFPQVTDEMVGYIDAGDSSPQYAVPGEDPLQVFFNTGAYGWGRAAWALGGTGSPTFNDVTVEFYAIESAVLPSGRL